MLTELDRLYDDQMKQKQNLLAEWVIGEILRLAALSPTGLPDPAAADKLLKEREEFRQAQAAGDEIGAFTELADRIYYACKEIATAAIEAGVSLEQALEICLIKYGLRINSTKNDAAERSAIADFLARENKHAGLE